MTREQLLDMQQRLQDAAASPGYSPALKEQARREADLIQERLDEGDFRVGDRIVLRVQGAFQFTDTVTVQAGRVVTLPDIGEIPLTGVLRAELQDHMEEELGRYVQDPMVRARSLIRIAVLGAVSDQGFFAIPADALIEDALMIAGGPAENADIDGTEIRRGEQVLLGGDGFQQAIIDGRTLDQLGLRAGDRIIVPARAEGFFSGGVVRGLLTIVPTVVLILTRFSRR
jgi:protein involved in polysaccharide export with SLBB domain